LITAFVEDIAGGWDVDTEWHIAVPELDALARAHGVSHS
jgi:hypothetical protein